MPASCRAQLVPGGLAAPSWLPGSLASAFLDELHPVSLPGSKWCWLSPGDSLAISCVRRDHSGVSVFPEAQDHSWPFFFFRKINLEDLVLQQVMEGRKGVLCILTEKIMTSQKCVISEHELMEASCGGMLETQTQILQVSSTEDENLVNDSNVVLEIPAPTTIAFSVTELYVKLDGQFDICFLQGRHGGFEEKVKKKCSHKKFMFCRVYPPSDIVDKLEYGECFPDGPLNALRQDTLHLEKDFYPFVELPGEQQTTLKNILQAALSDDELLMVMETVFDDMARDLSPPMALVEELTPPQQEHIRTLLELVGCSLQGEGPGQEDAFSNPELFSTAHLLVSALAELPDNATALLGTCWKLQMVPMLCHLLCTLSDDGKCDLEDPNLAPLKDEETFGTVQHLLALTDISLERLQSSVNVVILKDWNVLPKILTISLNGLCALEHRTNAITQ
ncbi:gasdermin-E [Rhynchocyon petersi]